MAPESTGRFVMVCRMHITDIVGILLTHEYYFVLLSIGCYIALSIFINDL